MTTHRWREEGQEREREKERVPADMSDKSTEGEKQGTEGVALNLAGGAMRKVGTRKRAQTVGKMQRLK